MERKERGGKTIDHLVVFTNSESIRYVERKKDE